ncbi:hypothetical protein CMU26_15590 [Elizabethkingia anophelis]|nr:hypothetical protein [Elizabethkingia anophelis]
MRDSSEKPTARYERGLVAQVKKSNIHLLLMKLANKVLPDPEGHAQRKIFLKVAVFVASPLIVLLRFIGFLYIIL